MRGEATERPDGSALCTACGLCCTGLLFDRAPLEEHEVELAERLRLPIVSNAFHDAFALPCPRQEERRCTVYASRPAVCGSYACGLLRRFEAGEVPLGEALARVRRVERLAAEARAPGADRAWAAELRAALRADLDP